MLGKRLRVEGLGQRSQLTASPLTSVPRTGIGGSPLGDVDELLASIGDRRQLHAVLERLQTTHLHRGGHQRGQIGSTLLQPAQQIVGLPGQVVTTILSLEDLDGSHDSVDSRCHGHEGVLLSSVVELTGDPGVLLLDPTLERGGV